MLANERGNVPYKQIPDLFSRFYELDKNDLDANNLHYRLRAKDEILKGIEVSRNKRRY